MDSNNIKKYISNISKYSDDIYSDFIFKETVTSTNTLLRDMAKKGVPSGTVLMANEQTSGRGRLGRSFHSPTGTGLYFSILLRPEMPASDSLFLTTSAAVAVARSIEKLSGRSADIKWVNDIYIDNKKVCGILTEGSINVDGYLDYAIVGIGINIWNPTKDFPEEIQNIAGAIFETSNLEYSTDIKEKLIAEILNQFMDFYINFSEKTFLAEYKNRSFLIGKQIYIIEDDNRTPATAIDIDDECHLIVKLDNGEIKTLSSGEVSIKIL